MTASSPDWTYRPVPRTAEHSIAGRARCRQRLSLLVRAYVLPLEGYCLDPTNPLRLTNVTVTYDGVEAVPTAVADFLPPILRRLTIYVDPALSMGVSDAVVQLAAAVSAHYGPQNPAITVTRLGDGPGPLAGGGQPFERRIVITEAPDTGVSLQPGADGCRRC